MIALRSIAHVHATCSIPTSRIDTLRCRAVVHRPSSCMHTTIARPPRRSTRTMVRCITLIPHTSYPRHQASLLGSVRAMCTAVADARLVGAAVVIAGTLLLLSWSWISGRLTQPSTYWKTKAKLKLPDSPVIPPHMPKPRAASDVQSIVHADAPPNDGVSKSSLPSLVAELVQRVQELEATTAQLKDDTAAKLREAGHVMQRIHSPRSPAEGAPESPLGEGVPNTADLQRSIVHFVSSDYLDTVTQVREQLMLREWELDGKIQAKLRGVAAFERHIAGHHPGTLPYDTISKLYDNPDDLEAMHNGRLEAWGRCTSDAKELTAFVRQGDILQQLFPTEQLLKAARSALGSALPIPGIK